MMKWDKATIFLLAVLASYMIWGLLIYLPPTFYPTEAESRGATPSQYGLVFGIPNLAAFITAPLFGIYGQAIDPSAMCLIGAFMQGICGILFAFLGRLDNLAAFLGLSYLLRFVDGVSDAASWTALISILLLRYPNNSGAVISWTEIAFDTGSILGPVVGSALYIVGGFELPFLVVGPICLAFASLLWITLPSTDRRSQGDVEGSSGPPGSQGEASMSVSVTSSSSGTNLNHKEDETQGIAMANSSYTTSKIVVETSSNQNSEFGANEIQPLRFIDTLKSPYMLLANMNSCLAFAGMAFIEGMLEPYMKNSLGATQWDVTVVFLILSVIFIITSAAAGLICDRVSNLGYIELFAAFLEVVAFMLFGPAPFLNMVGSVTQLEVSSCVIGVATSTMMVVTFARAHRAALAMGFPDNIATNLIVTGGWSSATYLGAFIGPTFGGFIVDAYGFQTTMMGFFGIFICSFLINAAVVFYETFYQKVQKADYEDIEPGSKTSSS